MPDEFNPPDEADDDRFAAPEIPDPEPLLPPHEDPAPEADPLTLLGQIADDLQASDAPQTPIQDAQEAFAAIQAAGDRMVGSDASRPGYPRQAAHQRAQAANHEQADFLARERVAAAGRSLPDLPPQEQVPTSFADFLAEVERMKRSDGSPAHPNAKARAYRRYQQLQNDMGLESPLGQEHLELEARESERAYYQAEKQRLAQTDNLLKLLTVNAIESLRRIAALEDALLRSRQ